MTTYVKGSPNHWSGDMTDTVVVYKKGSLNNYGSRTISATPTSFSCRVISDVKNSRDEQGNEIVEGGTLYILSDANVEVGDRLDLPGSNADPRIISVDKVSYSANGTATVHHTKVRFGSIGG
jgi:hypothetical protein